MTITALPTAPTPSDTPEVFEARITALVAALPQLVTQANALEATLTAVPHQGTATDSLTIGTGSKSLTTQAGKAWAVGSWLYIINSAAIANYMVGQITAHNSGTGALTVNVTTTGGAGTAATWAISLATPPGAVSGLSGGTAGVVPYQSGVGVTGFTAAGTAGQVLQSNGTAAPSWTSTPQVGGESAGYLGLPIVNKTAAYTAAATERGRCISITTGGVTVPAAIFAPGDSFVVCNNSSTPQNIVQGASTMLHKAGTTGTGTCVLAPWGLATVLCIATNVYIVSGNIT